MKIMKELWDELGYQGHDFTCQNLRDQAARQEKSLGNVGETICERVGTRRPPPENEREICDMLDNSSQSLQTQTFENANEPELQHSVPQESLCQETKLLLDSAIKIFDSIKSEPGEFMNRDIDTRTKERPSQREIENINKAITELTKTTSFQTNDPFVYLWIANCALYAVTVAFLLHKGWKKQKSSTSQTTQNNYQNKMKAKYERKVSEMRKKISIAAAEVERLKANKKITKKGRRNRAVLLEECKVLSVAQLVNYMEKKKSTVRRLKREYSRRKKQQQSREFNNQFQTDPGRVYAKFGEMIAEDKDLNRPKYKPRQSTISNETDANQFEDTEEASSFWRQVWSEGGTGNRNATWLEDVREAINKYVPPPSNENFVLESTEVVKTIMKKRNWSAPGPDRIANYWWKKAHALHEGVTKSFQSIGQSPSEYPMWFAEGKTTLIPKPGEFSSSNQRPITCLNTMYKWFTSCLLGPMDCHLNEYGLMEGEQRGAKSGCSGTVDNLLIDRMVTQDCHRGKRNLSMAWIDVKKAFDSVDHEWLAEMMILHRFPTWLCRTIESLCNSWNTKVVAKTKQGIEKSEVIQFRRGLPQGDALCPRLFTLCMNLVAWKLRASEGYKLSKPLSTKITDLLYVDDLKAFAASEIKLNKVLKSTKSAMQDIGLEWNPKKCATVHVRRGVQVKDETGVQLDDGAVLTNLKEGTYYKFLGTLENLKQDDKLALYVAAKNTYNACQSSGQVHCQITTA